jgi:hypothetical protein
MVFGRDVFDVFAFAKPVRATSPFVIQAKSRNL